MSSVRPRTPHDRPLPAPRVRIRRSNDRRHTHIELIGRAR
jgi:hypothetical protein